MGKKGRGGSRGGSRGGGGSIKRRGNEMAIMKQRAFGCKLAMWDSGQCDPKHCSGHWLAQHGYVKRLAVGTPFHGIALSHHGTRTLSPADREIVESNGLIVLDCSWSRTEEISPQRLKAQHVLLPFLVAANRINYGRPMKLNDAEAFAAAMYIVGLKDLAHSLLESFAYGEEFFKINYELLERYSECSNGEEVIAVQTQYLEASQAESQARKNGTSGFDPYAGLPDYSDESESEEEEEGVDSGDGGFQAGKKQSNAFDPYAGLPDYSDESESEGDESDGATKLNDQRNEEGEENCEDATAKADVDDTEMFQNEKDIAVEAASPSADDTATKFSADTEEQSVSTNRSSPDSVVQGEIKSPTKDDMEALSDQAQKLEV